MYMQIHIVLTQATKISLSVHTLSKLRHKNDHSKSISDHLYTSYRWESEEGSPLSLPNFVVVKTIL